MIQFSPSRCVPVAKVMLVLVVVKGSTLEPMHSQLQMPEVVMDLGGDGLKEKRREVRPHGTAKMGQHDGGMANSTF